VTCVDFDVIVIGAGCGGLTAGALLAARGWRVLLLEQSGAVGGCASSFNRGGYTYYPRGGMIQLPLALQRVGERHGMTVHVRSPVTKVLVERGRAIGVVMADGTELRTLFQTPILTNLECPPAASWSRSCMPNTTDPYPLQPRLEKRG
jgi:phytoene dehydrogenase-like protein